MITTSNGPVLSIIVTAHNCEDYLEQCLNSLETPAGEIPDGSEIILIDDDSEDRSPEICRNFSQKHANVKFFPVKFRNIGMVRNFALDQCSGQYVTMIDGDDRVIRGLCLIFHSCSMSVSRTYSSPVLMKFMMLQRLNVSGQAWRLLQLHGMMPSRSSLFIGKFRLILSASSSVAISSPG